MAVEAGLADDIGERAAELFRDAFDFAFDLLEIFLAVGLDDDGDARRAAVFAEGFAQGGAPFAHGVTPALAAAMEGGMMFRRRIAAAAQEFAERVGDRVFAARRAPGFQLGDLAAFGAVVLRHDRPSPPESGEVSWSVAVDADDDLAAASISFRRARWLSTTSGLHEVDIVDRAPPEASSFASIARASAFSSLRLGLTTWEPSNRSSYSSRSVS
jgi:hypothetical protein